MSNSNNFAALVSSSFDIDDPADSEEARERKVKIQAKVIVDLMIKTGSQQAVSFEVTERNENGTPARIVLGEDYTINLVPENQRGPDGYQTIR